MMNESTDEVMVLAELRHQSRVNVGGVDARENDGVSV